MRKGDNYKNSYNNYCQWKIGWLRTVDHMHILYDGLYNARKILSERAEFMSHLITGTTINDRMDWTGNYAELNYFIRELMKRLYIPYRYSEHLLMWEHFTLNGNEINLESSYTSKSRGVSMGAQSTLDLILDRMDSLQ